MVGVGSLEGAGLDIDEVAIVKLEVACWGRCGVAE
jgi:hypothetical protein